jgi:polar amino acid transport system substrate-binding protein
MTENHPALTLTPNVLQLFRMLMAGRIDVAVCSTLAAQSALQSLGGKEVDTSPELARFELHHYLHSRHRELAARLGEVTRRMKDRGELEQLTLEYEAAAAAAEPP